METFATNEAGHLAIAGHDAIDLADRFGAPLWVISAERIRANHDRLLTAFQHEWPDTRIVYASKANPSPAVVRVALGQGSMVDAVTAGHLRLLSDAGATPDRIVFNGNSKTIDELRGAVAAGLAFVNVDSLQEMETLAGIAPGVTARPLGVTLRLASKPADLEAEDPAMAAYEAETKFGMDAPDAVAAARIADLHPGLDLAGLHHHIGFAQPFSRELEITRQRHRIEGVMAFARQLHYELDGWQPRVINMGGGYRVGHPDGFGPGRLTDFPTADDYAQAVAGTLSSVLADAPELGRPRLLLEAGGYLVADAACLLARIGFTRTRGTGDSAIRMGFVEDTSGYHFVRRLMQDFYYRTVLASRMNDPAPHRWTLYGPVCAPDDLARDVPLPDLRRGDLIAMLDNGAYCEAVTSDYCAIPTPATVMVDGPEAAVIRRRETTEDIAARFVGTRLVDRRVNQVAGRAE